jgi:N-acetylglucosaminyldiphosphoundecaprenol N-acetyl-beta-D-mannosaminyltransferase
VEREDTGPSVVLFGVPICAVKLDVVIGWVDDAVRLRRRLRLGVVNAAKIVNMRRDPELGRDVLSSDAILADGMSVVWASRLVGKPLPERVAGIDVMLRILDHGRSRGYRIYLLGATAAVLEAAATILTERYSGIEIVGLQHGFFAADEEADVARRICESRADVLFVGMTSPRKERFMARWGEGLGVPVVHGVGGSFDVVAGKVKRAPDVWQRFGVEWLYRVKQEPRRLWRRYLVTNSLFAVMTFWEVLRAARRRDA